MTPPPLSALREYSAKLQAQLQEVALLADVTFSWAQSAGPQALHGDIAIYLHRAPMSACLFTCGLQCLQILQG